MNDKELREKFDLALDELSKVYPPPKEWWDKAIGELQRKILEEVILPKMILKETKACPE